eukprot:TRINITY_DN6092_c0_g2_i6.p1 TRINITY_DN6092_c0_g2~~TRINITY_DN6092_c0_g2_i6.p1  ORF type:complete len:271 (-),score=22.60 TRINITY_DN6092_c0_g2_i6:22-771(-)
MASEYMDCGSLAGFVKKRGPIPEVALRHIFRQVVRGLDYLHTQHYLHRDIKPDNILLHHDGECKIADFGLMTQLRDTMDQTSTFMGTLAYLSPERVSAGGYGLPSDTWAVGMTLIFCALGQLPFASEDYFDVMDRITKGEPLSLSKKDGFSTELISFVDRCLRRDAAERASCKELMQHPWLSRKPRDDDALLQEWHLSLMGDPSDLKQMLSVIVDKRGLDSNNLLFSNGKIGRAVQQECRDRSRMPSSA